MSKYPCALAVAVLLLCSSALSSDLNVDSSQDLDLQSQLQLLETEVAQIAVSEKDLNDIIALQEGGDPLTDQEKNDLAKLQELQRRQEKEMLKDEDFDLPLHLLKHGEHTKCNAVIIKTILSIVRTAKIQVRLAVVCEICLFQNIPLIFSILSLMRLYQVSDQIKKVEEFLTSADYARHLIAMMK